MCKSPDDFFSVRFCDQAIAKLYVVAYINSIRLEKRKAQFGFVSDQIRYLYGPLHALCTEGDTLWREFRKRVRPGGDFFSKHPVPPTEEEAEQFRRWTRIVFMPLNVQRAEIIKNNMHLMEGDEMPPSFKQLLVHADSYKIVLEGWDRNKYDVNTAYNDYPREISKEVTATFDKLRERQKMLMKSRSFRIVAQEI